MCPFTRCRAVDAQDSDPLASFTQRHANECRNLTRAQLRSLRVREPWVGVGIADDGCLAAPAGVDDGLAEARHVASAGKRRSGAGIRSLDDEFVALDLGVVDARRLQ